MNVEFRARIRKARGNPCPEIVRRVWTKRRHPGAPEENAFLSCVLGVKTRDKTIFHLNTCPLSPPSVTDHPTRCLSLPGFDLYVHTEGARLSRFRIFRFPWTLLSDALRLAPDVIVVVVNSSHHRHRRRCCYRRHRRRLRRARHGD